MEGCSGRCRKGFYSDDAGWDAEVRSGRFREGFILTIRGSLLRLAPDDFVKVDLDDPGLHGEV